MLWRALNVGGIMEFYGGRGDGDLNSGLAEVHWGTWVEDQRRKTCNNQYTPAPDLGEWVTMEVSMISARL